jgi:predicted nucleotidyltransferase
MSETPLHITLRTIIKDLADSKSGCALVGGLAVSARTEPRFTRDIDLAVAVTRDDEAESLVRFLNSRNYHIEALVEQEATGRLATVRLAPHGTPSMLADLLFASSGIEPEIVAAAEPIEIIEGLVVRVATVPFLIATKVLSHDDKQRPQDRADLMALFKEASNDDIAAAREALRMIHDRGFHRGKDLMSEFDHIRGDRDEHRSS